METKTLEATSNSYKGVEASITFKKTELEKTTKVKYGEMRYFGNCELGYKMIQDYTVIK